MNIKHRAVCIALFCIGCTYEPHAISLEPLQVDHFELSPISSPTHVGDWHDIAITAVDQAGNVVTSYDGTIDFESSDAFAILPAAYTFTEEDGGAHAFSAAIMFQLTGTHSVQVSDGEHAGLLDDILVKSEWSKKAIFRSVGPGRAAPLAVGTSSNLLSIDNSAAVFAIPIADEVGVGDAVEYDSNDDDTMDTVAFVHRRVSATQFVVMSPHGVRPTSTSIPTGNWIIHRAYTSLEQAERGEINPSITMEFDSWSNGPDLVTDRDVIWNIACYADGPDHGPVTINGWTTSPDNYLRIFTPNTPFQVGVSQRHRGHWDDSKYHLVADGSAGVVSFTHSVRIEGLQLQTVNATGGGHKTLWVQHHDESLPGSDIRISHNLLRGMGASPNFATGLAIYQAGSGVARVWNNILYDYRPTGGDGHALLLEDADFTMYLYNNTVFDSVNCFGGSAGTVVARNNLAQLCGVIGFRGEFDSSSDHNLSNDDSAPNDSFAGINSTVVFANPNEDNLHLSADDNVARGAGMDLSQDEWLDFTDDIDGDERTGAWNIGADQS